MRHCSDISFGLLRVLPMLCLNALCAALKFDGSIATDAAWMRWSEGCQRKDSGMVSVAQSWPPRLKSEVAMCT